MTETPKKTAPVKFEQTAEAMPRIAAARPTAETPAPGAEKAAPETGQADMRSISVPKLDQFTVWKVIELLKSL